MWFQRKRSRGNWFLSLVGITGAYFLGRAAGKHQMPNAHSNNMNRTQPWDQDIPQTDIDTDPNL